MKKNYSTPTTLLMTCVAGQTILTGSIHSDTHVSGDVSGGSQGNSQGSSRAPQRGTLLIKA